MEEKNNLTNNDFLTSRTTIKKNILTDKNNKKPDIKKYNSKQNTISNKKLEQNKMTPINDSKRKQKQIKQCFLDITNTKEKKEKEIQNEEIKPFNEKEKENEEKQNISKDGNKSELKTKNPSLKQSNKNLLENTKTQPKNIKIIQRKQLLNKFIDDSAPKKKEKEEILEISVTDDLPKEAYENYYSIVNSSDENNRLRREREIEIEHKKAAKLAEIEREKRAKQKLYRRVEKDFDSNRLTFDPNGKIINLRTINEPLSGDFVSSRIKIRGDLTKKKEILELKDIVYPIQGNELNNIKDDRNDYLNNKEIYKENKDINNSNIKPKNPSLKQSNKNLLENTKTQPKKIKIISGAIN